MFLIQFAFRRNPTVGHGDLEALLLRVGAYFSSTVKGERIRVTGRGKFMKHLMHVFAFGAALFGNLAAVDVAAAM